MGSVRSETALASESGPRRPAREGARLGPSLIALGGLVAVSGALIPWSSVSGRASQFGPGPTRVPILVLGTLLVVLAVVAWGRRSAGLREGLGVAASLCGLAIGALWLSQLGTAWVWYRDRPNGGDPATASFAVGYLLPLLAVVLAEVGGFILIPGRSRSGSSGAAR